MENNDAAVLEAATAFEAATQRTAELAHAAAVARQEAARIAAEGDAMLSAVAAGEGEATDGDLLDSAEKARRATAVADIAEAKSAASQRQREMAQIKLLRAQGGAHTEAYRRAVDLELALSDEVDSRFAELQDAIAAYNEACKATHAAFVAAHNHNGLALNPGHHHNATLAGLPTDQQPRAIVPQHAASLTGVKAELFTVNGYGFNAGQRTVITALLPRVRRNHNRPVEKVDA
jgi:hypothetical protein